VLLQELTVGQQRERLHAAIVLNETDEQARPVAEQMRAGLDYEKGFNSEGKYRVRVTDRMLKASPGRRTVTPVSASAETASASTVLSLDRFMRVGST